MRTLVAGAGATGGYFGARLAQAGRDVTFLVRPGRAAQLRRDGLRVVSPHGDLALAPQLLVAGDIAGPFGLVMLAVKAYALEQALTDLAPIIGARTMIVPLLNGMRHIDLLVERFGEAPVLGGVCVVAATVDAEGRIVQLAEMQELAYGERSGAASPRIGALDEAMQGAGFKARRSDTIMQDMWEKWVMLATAGGVTCLLRGNVGEIEAVPGGADLGAALPRRERVRRRRSRVCAEGRVPGACARHDDGQRVQLRVVDVSRPAGQCAGGGRAHPWRHAASCPRIRPCDTAPRGRGGSATHLREPEGVRHATADPRHEGFRTGRAPAALPASARAARRS